jgi:tyrosine-protein kinase Etk/Wzc
LLVPTGQAEAMLRAASQLRAEVLSRQAQLAGMKTYVSEENPSYQSVKQQIASLQSELSALEKGGQPGDLIDLPVGKLPQAGLEYLRRYREVRYHESLFEALAKQYEAARLDEAKASPLVQIIDAAVVPEKKSWPPRLIIILGTTLLAAVCASLWTLLRFAPETK